MGRPVTVLELIEKLSSLDPAMPVVSARQDEMRLCSPHVRVEKMFRNKDQESLDPWIHLDGDEDIEEEIKYYKEVYGEEYELCEKAVIIEGKP